MFIKDFTDTDYNVVAMALIQREDMLSKYYKNDADPNKDNWRNELNDVRSVLRKMFSSSASRYPVVQ